MPEGRCGRSLTRAEELGGRCAGGVKGGRETRGLAGVALRPVRPPPALATARCDLRHHGGAVPSTQTTRPSLPTTISRNSVSRSAP